MMESLRTVPSALFEGMDLQRTLEQIGAALRSPGEHRSIAVMMVVMVAIAVVLLIIFLLLLATPAKKKRVVRVRVRPAGELDGQAVPAHTDQPAQRMPGRLFLALTGPAAVAILTALSLIGLYVVTGTNYYCGKTCHTGSASTRQALKQAHADCAACHEASPVLGAPVNVVSRFEMAWKDLRGAEAAAAAQPVDSAACLRCHGDLLQKTVVGSGGVAMAHKDVESIPCTQCHERAGHEGSAESISMSDCIGCHDSRTASTECCHVSPEGPGRGELHG